MSLPIRIVDGCGKGTRAVVSDYGQLVTAPIAYSTASDVKMEVAGTAYNYVTPVQGSRIVITDILLYANKNVGAGDATVTIYGGSTASATAETQTIFTTEMPKNTSRDIAGVNLIVDEGLFLNGKTDDDDIFCTIMYYYVSPL